MDDLESYEPQTSEVISVEPGWATLYLEDRIPEFGEAVGVEVDGGDVSHVIARDRTGGRKVRALRLGDEEQIASGCPARATGRTAGFVLAANGSVDTRTTSVVPEPKDPDDRWIPVDWEAPEFAELRGESPPLATGYEELDLVAPVVEGGLNLVIDTSQTGEPSRHLETAIAESLAPIDAIRAPVFDDEEPRGWVTHEVCARRRAPDPMTAIRLAVALAADRRATGTDAAVCIDLPPVGRTPSSDERRATEPGYGRIVDLLGSGLASTESASLTSIVRLRVPASEVGIGSIVETLDVGDVDAQIFVDNAGRFAPTRSTSDAHRTEEDRRRVSEALGRLRQAEQAREKRDLFGARELSEAEREALQRAEALHTDLTSPPP